MRYYLIILMLVFSFPLFGDFLNYDKVIKNNTGVDLYQKKDIDKAEKTFSDNVLNNPKDGYLRYNLGNAAFKRQDYDKSINEYKLALKDKEFSERSAAFQNLGNAHFQKQEYKKALDNFKNALIEDGNNQAARYNYELAKRFLQNQQNQKQKKQSNQDQNEDNKDKEKEKQQNQQNQQNQQDKKQEQKQQKVQKREKKEAEKMLKAVLAEEKEKLKEKKENEKADAIKSGHYW